MYALLPSTYEYFPYLFKLWRLVHLPCHIADARDDCDFDAHVLANRRLVSKLEYRTSVNIAPCRRTIVATVACRRIINLPNLQTYHIEIPPPLE
jgi:hypothetical protein